MILICWLATYYGTAREPQYQGRSLSEWLEQAQIAYAKCPDQEHPERDPAYLVCKVAINQMGTNCIPFLLDDLLAKESKLRQEISSLAKRPALASILTRNWAHKLRMVEADGEHHTMRLRIHALFGFEALEQNAKYAEPALVKLTTDADRDRRFWGYVAFADTKPTKEVFLPVAICLMKDPDEEIRTIAAGTIQSLYPEEAERLGVYAAFPDLRPQTNQIVMP
jgi:hypothetical protein